MVSVIRVGQSKFVAVPIDEDSNERIMNCIQTLSNLDKQQAVQDIFLKDTKAAYSKMILAQEVRDTPLAFWKPKTYLALVFRKKLRRRKPQRQQKRPWFKSTTC